MKVYFKHLVRIEKKTTTTQDANKIQLSQKLDKLNIYQKNAKPIERKKKNKQKY